MPGHGVISNAYTLHKFLIITSKRSNHPEASSSLWFSGKSAVPYMLRGLACYTLDLRTTTDQYYTGPVSSFNSQLLAGIHPILVANSKLTPPFKS